MAMYLTASENEEDRAKIHAVKEAAINAGAVISVFGIQLMGAVEKNAEGTRILVCPSLDNSGQSVSLEKICSDANIGKNERDAIDEIIKYLGFSGGIAGTNIDVHQAFYYYSSNEKDKANNDVKHEYAFSLGITNTLDSRPTGFPFTIESISVSLWNSTREKLVESMGVYTISNILAKFS